MTLKEAKKILESEGFKLGGPGKSGVVSEFFTEYESPKICEAMQVVCSAGYGISMVSSRFDDRKARLSLELAENSAPMPGPGEEQPKEGNLKAATKMFGVQAREIMRLTAENAELRETIDKMKEGNPALKESATQFNDALLDEQAKKIAELTKENDRLERVSKTTTDEFNKLYYRMITKSDKIEALGKEIAKLNGIIHEKKKVCCELVAENTDLKEHLAESKESAKNFASLLSDAYDELRELKKKYADKVVDEINAQALKSAESALAWKEKVIAEKDMALAYYEKKIAEKDEVIDNLRKELKAQKGLVNHISKKYDGAKINLNLRMKECDKLEKELDEAKKQNTAVMVDMTAKCLRAARESINDVFESYAAKYVKSTLDDLKEKAYESFNAKACNLGLVGSKDGNGIFDQMVGVDNAEEVADLSGAIVLCGKDFIDAIKKMK